MRAFSIPEVCEQTSLTKTSIYSAISEGKLIARKFGKRTVITAADLDNFLMSLPAVPRKTRHAA